MAKSASGPICFLSIFVCVVCVVLAYISADVETKAFTVKKISNVKLPENVESVVHSKYISNLKGPAYLSFSNYEAKQQQQQQQEDGSSGSGSGSGSGAVRPVAYTGLGDGKLVRVYLDSGEVEKLLHTGRPDHLRSDLSCGDWFGWTEIVCGRPMGSTFDNDKLRLILAEPYKGLLSINVAENRSEVLAETVDGEPLKYISAVAISPKTGIIYISQISEKADRKDWQQPFFEGKSTGRVIAYDPNEATIKVLVKHLYYPSGLAVVQVKDAEYLFIAEPLQSRVRKYRLPSQAKPRGALDSWLEGLPLLPFGLSVAEPQDDKSGSPVLVISGPSRSVLTDLLPQLAAARRTLVSAPTIIADTVLRSGFSGRVLLVKISGDSMKPVGSVERVLSDSAMPFPTSAYLVNQTLYLASERASFIHVATLP